MRFRTVSGSTTEQVCIVACGHSGAVHGTGDLDRVLRGAEGDGLRAVEIADHKTGLAVRASGEGAVDGASFHTGELDGGI